MRRELKRLIAKDGWGGRLKHDGHHDGGRDSEDGSDDETSSDDDDETSSDDDDDDDMVEEKLDEKLKEDHLALFHVGDLMEFIQANFVCRACFVRDGVGAGVQASTSRVGLVTTLKYECKCNLQDTEQEGTQRKTQHSSILSPEKVDVSNKNNAVLSYKINHLFVLALHYSGLGYKDGVALCGILGMAKPFAYNTWQTLEQSVGKVVRMVCDELVDLDLQEEFDASPLNTMGFKDMVASFDMGWQGRKSGNSYNSASGFASFMGARMRQSDM